jgi:hypothetical protein
MSWARWISFTPFLFPSYIHTYVGTYIRTYFHQSNISPSAAGYETCHNIINININDRHRQVFIHSGASETSLSYRFSHRSPACIFFSHACCMPFTSHSPGISDKESESWMSSCYWPKLSIPIFKTICI